MSRFVDHAGDGSPHATCEWAENRLAPEMTAGGLTARSTGLRWPSPCGPLARHPGNKPRHRIGSASVTTSRQDNLATQARTRHASPYPAPATTT